MIYFDQSATSIIKPEGVSFAMAEALKNAGSAGRGAHGASLASGRIETKVRKQVAQFFGVSNSQQVVFTSGATYSLNTALSGFLKEGDEVVTTALEHNAVLRPLYRLHQEGIQLKIAPINANGNVSVESIIKQVGECTKLVVVTHASNVLGQVMDIKKLGEFCANKGIIFVVDASQSAGLLPIHMKEMHIDCLCCSAHKSLLGPQGIGLMLLSDKFSPRPLILGGTGTDSFSKTMPQTAPSRYEAGTLNTQGIAGMGAALSYIQETGLESLYEDAFKVAAYFYKKVSEIPQIKVYGDYREGFNLGERIPVVSININGWDSGEVADILWQEAKIAVRSGAHCAPLVHESFNTVLRGMVRFSFSSYNHFQEVDVALSLLKELAEEG